MIRAFLNTVFSVFITPKSNKFSSNGKEFVLNILLCGIIVLTTLGFIIIAINYINDPANNDNRLNPLFMLIFVFIFCLLLFISRIGHSKIAAYIFVFIFYFATVYMSYRWGVQVNQSTILYMLIIVLSGILIDSKFAFIIVLLETFALLLLSYSEIHGFHLPDYEWKSRKVNIGGTIFTGLTFSIMSIVSWLYNREVNNSLKRALTSEEILRIERDQLEVKVQERTQQLRQAEMEKLSQVYKFVEIGKASSGLIHDIVNPLNLISLNLDKLHEDTQRKGDDELQGMKKTLKRAVIGTRKLEEYVASVRGIIQNTENNSLFSISKEIKSAIQMLQPQAKASNVKVVVTFLEEYQIFGNPLKFSQVIVNLIKNAIEAYQLSKKYGKREIQISTSIQESFVTISILDYGDLINKDIKDKIFEPFFSTKKSDVNSGIGLYLCKDIIENNFKGNISVESNSKQTIFILKIPV